MCGWRSISQYRIIDIIPSDTVIMLIFSCYSRFSGVVCFRRQFSSRVLRCAVEVPAEQCVVAASARRLRPWDTLQRRIRPLHRRPWSVQTPAPCVQPRHRIARRRLPSTLPPSQLTTTPAIRWPGQGQWDQWERVDMLPAVHLFSQHRRSEWFHHYSSRRLGMAVHCRHRCMIFLNDHTFLVGITFA